MSISITNYDFNALPNELKLEIFAKVPSSEVPNLILVCKNWKKIILDHKEQLKIAIFLKIFSSPPIVLEKKINFAMLLSFKHNVCVDFGFKGLIVHKDPSKNLTYDDKNLVFLGDDFYILRPSDKECVIYDIETKERLFHFKSDISVFDRKRSFDIQYYKTPQYIDYDKKQKILAVVSNLATLIILKNAKGDVTTINRTTLKANPNEKDHENHWLLRICGNSVWFCCNYNKSISIERYTLSGEPLFITTYENNQVDKYGRQLFIPSLKSFCLFDSNDSFIAFDLTSGIYKKRNSQVKAHSISYLELDHLNDVVIFGTNEGKIVISDLQTKNCNEINPPEIVNKTPLWDLKSRLFYRFEKWGSLLARSSGMMHSNKSHIIEIFRVIGTKAQLLLTLDSNFCSIFAFNYETFSFLSQDNNLGQYRAPLLETTHK